MKKILREERDPLPSCSFCEWAKLSEKDNGEILCTKYDDKIVGRHSCASYSYDLLKRRPLRMRTSFHLSETLVEIEEEV